MSVIVRVKLAWVVDESVESPDDRVLPAGTIRGLQLLENREAEITGLYPQAAAAPKLRSPRDRSVHRSELRIKKRPKDRVNKSWLCA